MNPEKVWDNAKLQSVEQNVNSRLDVVENKTEVIKSIESQLGKHQKSLSDVNTEQPAHTSKLSNSPPQISDNQLLVLQPLLPLNKKKEKRRLNIIVHDVEGFSAEEGKVRKTHDIEKCKDLFQTYLGTTVTIEKAFHLGKQSSKPRLLKLSLTSDQEKASKRTKAFSSSNPPNIHM